MKFWQCHVQVVGSSYQSSTEPDLYMCLRCHYLESTSPSPSPSLQPFKRVRPVVADFLLRKLHVSLLFSSRNGSDEQL